MEKISIVVVLGESKSGKDTFADILADVFGYSKVQMVDDLLDFLEDHYGLARGQSRCQTGREYRPNNGDYSIQDIKIALYELFIVKGLDPQFAIPFLKRELQKALLYQRNLALVGVRSHYELKAILDFYHENRESVDLKPILLEREESINKLSDKKLPLIVKVLDENVGVLVWDNNQDEDTLRQEITFWEVSNNIRRKREKENVNNI